jgi:hypothetical protein
LRKAIAGVLGLPVIVATYVALLARRPTALSTTAVAAIVGLLTIAAMSGTAPPITAYKTIPVDPHAAARMASSVVTDFGIHQTVRIDFSAAMDRASVEAALRVSPAAAPALSWLDEGRSLRIAPSGAWAPSRFYTVTIGREARDAAGTPLAEPLRVIFFTRDRPTVELAMTDLADEGTARPGSTLELRFSRPVDPTSVARALRVTPATAGRLVATADPGQAGAERFLWVPDAPLAPGTPIAFHLAASVGDADGLRLAAPAHLSATVAARPRVVRSRPAKGGQGVDRDQTISVRFSEKMDRRTTQAALSVSGLDTKKGRFRWAEGDTVLIFDPSTTYAYGAAVTIKVAGSARSSAGVPLADDSAAVAFRSAFRVEPKPTAPARPTTKPPVSGGGSTSSAPWLSVEKYYLGLVNCTRTGGWVQSDGSCAGYGSGRYSTYVAPLSLSAGISSRVARPYAKYLANGDICSHYADGDPGGRLNRGGYSSYRWGENLGCRSGNPYSAVLASHLFFQSVESANSGHWRNIKDARFSVVGIGIWVASGRVRLVSNFYHP